MAAERATKGPQATKDIVNDHATRIDDITGFINAMQAQGQGAADAGTVKRFYVIENGTLDVHEWRTVKVGANV